MTTIKGTSYDAEVKVERGPKGEATMRLEVDDFQSEAPTVVYLNLAGVRELRMALVEMELQMAKEQGEVGPRVDLGVIRTPEDEAILKALRGRRP